MASTIKIKRGLDLPIHGRVESTEVHERLSITSVALLPPQFHGIKVKLLADEGSEVRAGQPLFCDRRDEAVLFTAPASGRLVAIERGARRAPLALRLEVSSWEDRGGFAPLNPIEAGNDAVRARLLESGLWPALRRRPFDSVARSDDSPVGIVVSAADTRPLAVSPRTLIAGREAQFQAGLQVLTRLTDAPVYLAARAGEDWSSLAVDGVAVEDFDGPHPAGNAGVAIHHLCPVGAGRVAWHVGVQDVADIGELFLSGALPRSRTIAVTGPAASSPKLLRTRPGADLGQALAGESDAEQPRFVDGSALDGRIAALGSPSGFLGRYTNQVTVLEDRTRRQLLGWMSPFAGRYSVTNTLLDKFVRKRFVFDTDSNGSLRAIVPIGVYEKVMPMDVLPTALIKALASHDMEMAEKLGVLELAEEDLALCEYVDPCKLPIAELLREMLTQIEKEG
jgi:Na+-transporting NADH:ubiquinone oxidoreductase subunit A